jgi:signal peptidase
MNIKRFKELFLRFWRSKDGKISLLRDVLVALLAVFIIIMILWSYTGQWLGTPMVAIESGSMMHADEGFGRLGTIDAGDMVLLVKVTKRSDIVTYGSAKNQGNDGLKTYGNYGDVVVYRKYGDTEDDQIIHRAMCWIEVEINGTEKTYTVEEYGIYNEKTLYIPEIGIQENNRAVSPDWSHSGFITKGDNPYTNKECDQLGGICDEPIKIEWITGKARSELPWIGTINLFFNDLVGGAFWDNNKEVTVANVQSDSIACLIILLAVLISIPIILDLYDYYKTKKKQQI